MNAVVNPLTFASERIKSPGEQAIFLGRLSALLDQYFKQLNTYQSQIATLQSQVSALQNPVSTNLGTISTNQTINCLNSPTVSFGFGQTAAFNPTITLTNLAIGVPVFFRNTNNSGASRTIAVAATNPASASYTVGFISAIGTVESANFTANAGTAYYSMGMSLNSSVGILLGFLVL